MSYEIPDFLVGVWPADIDMSQPLSPSGDQDPTYQYTGVCVYTALSTQGTGVGGAALCPPASTSTPIIGILQNNPQQGEAGTVMLQGVSKAKLSAACNIGDILMADDNGNLLPATSGEYGVAQALEKGASGDVSTVLIRNFGKQ